MAEESFYPFWIISLLFFAVGFVGSVGVKAVYNKGPSANQLHSTLIITAVVCCWMMWAIIYIAQYRPLVVPILKGEGE